MLTVIIPTKNHGSYLEHLITNVIFADNSPVTNLLICNDGSTDDTASILEKFSGDKRIRIFHNEKSKGAIGSVVMMYTHVETPYVMFLASDDYFFPDKIARLFDEMIKNDAYVGFGKYVIEDGGQIIELNHPGWQARRQADADEFCSILGFDHYTSFIVAIVKCETLPKYGPDNSPWDLSLDRMAGADGMGEFRAQDWTLALDMAKTHPDRFYFLDEYCGCFRKVASQLSSDDTYVHTGRAAYEMAMLILRYLQDYELRKRVKKSDYFKTAIRNLLYAKAGQISDTAKQSHNFVEIYKPILLAADALLINM
ncbi:glycosyltransferase family 2 protein [Herbaspirillum rhizosphaerae]|uniref:Glycosyltransferase family 2 protein n=1 Tax=Herbaspirillum rhizosphaerae TaxID=346179 RepID=A0ABW8ZAA1_9BURK